MEPKLTFSLMYIGFFFAEIIFLKNLKKIGYVYVAIFNDSE